MLLFIIISIFYLWFFTSIFAISFATGHLDLDGVYEEILKYLEELLMSGLLSPDIYLFLIVSLLYYFLSNIWRSRTQSSMYLVPITAVEDDGLVYTGKIDLNDPWGIRLMMLYHSGYKDTWVRTITNPWLNGRSFVAIMDPVSVTDTLYETPDLYRGEGGVIDLMVIRPRRDVWRRLIRSEGLVIETGDSVLFIREVTYTRDAFIPIGIERNLYYTRSTILH